MWIAALRNRMTPQVARMMELSTRERLIVGDVIMLEVLRGARDDHHAARLERNLRRYVVHPMLTDAIAISAARNSRTMRTRGITVRKTIDLIIGTFCIERGRRLLHDDRDFEPMESNLGLSVVR